RRQLLVQYGPGGPPTYYLPRSDVAPDALEDETPTPRAAAGGRCGPAGPGRSGRPGPLRIRPARSPRSPTTSRSRGGSSRYEEDERVVMHARDPYKRVDTAQLAARPGVRRG